MLMKLDQVLLKALIQFFADEKNLFIIKKLKKAGLNFEIVGKY